jgi:putative transposase
VANGEWKFTTRHSLLATRHSPLTTHYRKKGQSDSFRYPDPKQIRLDQTNRRIFLPKLGWVRYRHSRDVLGAVKNVTVSRGDRPVTRTGRWYVSIQTAREL